MKLSQGTKHQGRLALWLTLLGFLLLYSLISLVNHYNFRTFALDLGMFNQALYAYSKGQAALFTLYPNGSVTNFLATHFSPITLLYTPLYFLFGSYTLLIVQIVSILLGGIGMHRVAMLLSNNNTKSSLLILLQFLVTWGIFSALAYDFHNNVVGAMMVPWLLYCILNKRAIVFVVLSLLFWSTQETMGLWYPFLIAGLLWQYRSYWSRKQLQQLYLPLIAISIIYTIIVLVWLMPALQYHDHNLQFTRYAHLGYSMVDIVTHMIMHPLDTISMFFKNTLDDPDFNYIKLEFYLAFLISGGYFLIFNPRLLLLVIPIFAQKMLSNNFVFWGTNAQYSIECVPILAIATVSFFAKRQSASNTILILSLVLTSAVTIRLLDHRISKWYLPENARFYQKSHYNSFVDNEALKQVLQLIPSDVPISTSSRLAPHLANRKYLYHFPVIKNAQYIVVLKSDNDYWPLKDVATYFENIDSYRNNNDWELIQETKDVVVFKANSVLEKRDSFR